MRAPLAVAAALALLPAGARAQDVVRTVERVDPYVHVPGAKHVADRAHVYRVLFEGRAGAKSPDELTPVVNMAGTELNTLAAHGVPRKNVNFVVVFHTTGSDDAVLDNAHYRARHGVDNPNLPVLADLKRQGVKLFVCGQQMLADKQPLEAISPDVTLAEDGVVVLMMYGAQGYAHLTF